MKEFHHMTQEELRAVVDEYTTMAARAALAEARLATATLNTDCAMAKCNQYAADHAKTQTELDLIRAERDQWLKNYQAEIYEKEQAQEHAHAVLGERDALAQQAEDAVGRNVALLEENRLLNNILDALERLFEEWKAQRAATALEGS